MSIFDILIKIKSSIDIIVSIKVDEKLEELKIKKNENENLIAEDYETLLRNEEATIRKHIGIEQQLKLNLEKLIEKLEQYEEEKNGLMKKIVSKNAI